LPRATIQFSLLIMKIRIRSMRIIKRRKRKIQTCMENNKILMREMTYQEEEENWMQSQLLIGLCETLAISFMLIRKRNYNTYIEPCGSLLHIRYRAHSICIYYDRHMQVNFTPSSFYDRISFGHPIIWRHNVILVRTSKPNHICFK